MDLSSVVGKNVLNLQRDLSRFLHLDPFFDSQFSQLDNCRSITFHTRTAKKHSTALIDISASVTNNDLQTKTAPIIQAEIEPDGNAKFHFLQDVQEQTQKPKVFLFSLKPPYEYTSVRNQLFQHMHQYAQKHYATKSTVKKLLRGLV